MDAALVKREGKSLAELGPGRLEEEGDMLEEDGHLLENDAFDMALAAGQIDDDGWYVPSRHDLSAPDGTDRRTTRRVLKR